jgi:hypothetical protein
MSLGRVEMPAGRSRSLEVQTEVVAGDVFEARCTAAAAERIDCIRVPVQQIGSWWSALRKRQRLHVGEQEREI